QLMAKLKRGEQVSQRVRINSHELLVFTNRGTSGRDYMALVEALDRLEGTRIRTNIMTGDEEQIDGFGLIDASSIRRKQGLDGRLLWCEVKLSDWVFNAIRANEVLTLHRDYFRLRKPMERRVYEIARKHCGQQEKWLIGLDTLLKKTGSQSPLKRFRQMIRHLATHDHLPDYSVSFDLDSDIVTFRNRGSVCPALSVDSGASVAHLKPDTYERAKASAPGWDVYYIEREWREWLTEPPRKPDAAFIGFCKKWYEKRGAPR
ncbi:MAG: plasmid replication initiator, partial [Sphingobacteriia bacterium]|nr:plasmid replication initiator [Sphingobacteriia bacterium]